MFQLKTNTLITAVGFQGGTGPIAIILIFHMVMLQVAGTTSFLMFEFLVLLPDKIILVFVQL